VSRINRNRNVKNQPTLNSPTSEAIFAHSADLADITPYRRPEPIRYEQRQIAGQPRGYYETVEIDPEAPGYEPPSDEGMIPGRMFTR
jgi:hypothetical protein